MPRTRNETSEYPDGAAVVDRLQEAYGVQSLPALARSLGEGESTVKNWRYRGQVPVRYVIKASKDTQRSLEWLLTGESAPPAHRGGLGAALEVDSGEIVSAQLFLGEAQAPRWLAQQTAHGARSDLRRDAPKQGGTAPNLGALLPATKDREVHPIVLSLSLEQGATLNYEVIPRITAAPDQSAAGSQLDRAGEMAISHEWLGRHLFHTTGDLASVHVIGDSMAPTLIDGETIIIDRGVRAVVVDDIYLVDLMGRRLVKRLQRKTDGSIVIISDNPAYEREIVPRGRVPEIGIIGRKVWPRTR